MSDLRDRIAAVLSQHDVNLPDKVADAVIAELGLTRVTRSERVPIHRYVTEWKADDE